MQRHQDKLLWTVVFPSGATRRFKTREAAQAECLAYGGFKVVPPLYRDE